MNFLKENKMVFWFSLALHFAFGFQTFALDLKNAAGANHPSQNSSTLTDSEPDQPVEYDVFSLVKASQIVTPQEYSGAGLTAPNCSIIKSFSRKKDQAFSSDHYLEDQRRLLSRFLYPFFFFW